MGFPKLPKKLLEKAKAHLTPERLSMLKQFVKKRAIGWVGNAILNRKKKGDRMSKYTLRLDINVEASGRDVIDKAMTDATPHVYKYASDALAFFNMNGDTRFCGFKSDVSAVKTRKRSAEKPFLIQVDLFLEAPNKKAVEEPVSKIKDQVGQFAPMVLGFLGIVDKVKFQSMDAKVVKGHG